MSLQPAFFDPSLLNLKNSISQHEAECDCPIWGAGSKVKCYVFNAIGSNVYWSARAGGAFSFSDSLEVCLSNYIKTETDKIILSRWIFDQNQLGKNPQIFSGNIESILQVGDISASDKLNRLLELHDILSERPSIGLWASGFVIDNANEISALRQAGANLGTTIDYHWLRDAAVKEGLLEVHKYGRCNYTRLTPEGISRITHNERSSKSHQAFVAMWFDGQMDSAYENAILEAVNATGHSAYRVDKDNSHSDQITNKILAEIKQSKFLIADFTHGPDGARGGVYFEAGYALGLGIPVLWLIRKDDVSKMHFDTNHYPHIVWETEKQLKEQLEAAILAH